MFKVFFFLKMSHSLLKGHKECTLFEEPKVGTRQQKRLGCLRN